MALKADLTGHVALVTGASGGLGAGFARVLAANGATVVLAARRLDRLQMLAAELAAMGVVALPVEMDVTDEASVRAAFDAAETAVGVPDVIVNNSGIVGRAGRAADLTAADFAQVLAVNLTGAHMVAAEAARRIVAEGCPGSIINIASILGLRVAAGVAPYAASKAALVQLTRALALEWARHRIRVNAICPGWVVTDLNRDYLMSPAGEEVQRHIPQRRFGTVDDLAGPLLLLADDASGWMTGAVIAVDGGHLVSPL
jgi:NAD(P)-dependent dehydrogenase (short-subunit alcohol dehydrogenase family)